MRKSKLKFHQFQLAVIAVVNEQETVILVSAVAHTREMERRLEGAMAILRFRAGKSFAEGA